MLNKITNLLKENYVFPKSLLLKYQELKLNELELVILIYLLNEDSVFNPKKISIELCIPLKQVLNTINSLNEKGMLEIKKVTNNKMEEHIDMAELYKKLAFSIVNEKPDIDSTNLFDVFEKEFGRTLSPMELEIINAWIDNKFSEEIILEALKEAVYNGVSNLRYIDKIIYEWKKKGINNKIGISKDRENFKKQKKETKILEDYDWMNND